jgi:hypothetical protein
MIGGTTIIMSTEELIMRKNIGLAIWLECAYQQWRTEVDYIDAAPARRIFKGRLKLLLG